MEVKLSINENKILVKFSKELIVPYEYSFDDKINFTDMVQELSNIEEKIILLPEDFDKFKKGNLDVNEKLIKVVEYIYKIFNVFNLSYDKVYPNLVENNNA